MWKKQLGTLVFGAAMVYCAIQTLTLAKYNQEPACWVWAVFTACAGLLMLYCVSTLDEGPNITHWRTKTGRLIAIRDLSDQHLKNILRMLRGNRHINEIIRCLEREAKARGIE